MMDTEKLKHTFCKYIAKSQAMEIVEQADPSCFQNLKYNKKI